MNEIVSIIAYGLESLENAVVVFGPLGFFSMFAAPVKEPRAAQKRRARPNRKERRAKAAPKAQTPVKAVKKVKRVKSRPFTPAEEALYHRYRMGRDLGVYFD